MNRFLKFALWSAAGVFVLGAAAVAYIAMTFNPNDYKAQLIQLVHDKQQRTLKLDGDIKLVLFPSIGLEIGKVSLSEFQSEVEFVSMEHARVSVALLPLLSRQVVVDEISVSGLQAAVVKTRNGKSNIDDLLGKEEPAQPANQPVMFDIASVRIEKSGFSYRDERSGTQYVLHDINFKSGRIANGIPSKLDFSAAIKAKKPKLDISTQFQGTLTFDLEKNLYQVENLKFKAQGAVLDISNLLLQASGNAQANLDTQEFTANKLSVTASGSKGVDKFDARLEMPALNLTKNKFSSDTLTFNGTLGNMVAALTLHDLAGNAVLFKSRALTMEMEMQQAEQSFKAKLESPLSGNFEQQQFNLSNLTLAVQAQGDKLPNKSISSEMKGSVQIDGVRQSVQANLAGGLLQSQLQARVALNNFSHPVIRFDVEADQFDADLYLPKKSTPSPTQSVEAEQPMDFSILKNLDVQGSLNIGSLKAANIRLSQLHLALQGRNGSLNVEPFSANLYQGSMNGSLSVNTQTIPRLAIKQNLSGINIAPLLNDAINFDALEGRGKVTLNLNTQGNTVSEFKKALGGSMTLNLADGAIKGINIAQKFRDAQALLGKGSVQTQAANKGEKTDFSEMHASFKVENGVAHNDDLTLKSPLLRVSGKGDIDIGHDNINYLAKATLAKTLEGQGGASKVGGLTVPVRLSGQFTDLKYTVDFNAMASDAAKQKVEAKKEEVKVQLQNQIKNKLRDLFK
ncbi:MAG: AsmA family protein [Gallionellaceae bacterium]|nr:AsmA family protein [Gallionellaceae bacterium]